MAVGARQHSPPTQDDDRTTEAGRLFEQHGDRILGYCLREFGSRSEAEDALQTTFLYAHRALQRGVAPRAEYVWLQSIARNVCRWQRRTASRRGWVTGPASVEHLATVEAGPEANGERILEIKEALARVPDRQRRALLLRELHGLSSSEVAARLGISAVETYALLSRARRSFAKAMLALPGRSTLSINVWPLLLKLKGALLGSAAKLATTTVVVAGVAVGGVAMERVMVAEGEHSSPVGVPPPSAARHAGASPAPRFFESAPTRISGVAATRDGGSSSPHGSPGVASTGGASAYADDAAAGDATPDVGEAQDGPGTASSEPAPTAPAVVDEDPPELPLLDLDVPTVSELVPDVPLVGDQVDDPVGELLPEAPLPPLQDSGLVPSSVLP